MKPPRVILVGAGGYGRVHLRHLLEFHANGELALAAAVVLPAERDGEEALGLRSIGCTIFANVDEAADSAASLSLDLAIVPTPIHCHGPMTLRLLAAGLHVLVEKPIAATLEEVAAISEAATRNRRIVAVGFQYLHAPEVRAMKAALLAGAIGSPRRIVTHAAWPRSHAYYQRNNWAGKLRVAEGWVLDSPVNNAMSHFVMLMLFLAGRQPDGSADPLRMRAELYRAQAIESFDTAALHIETREGVRLEFYGTHSSANTGRPTLRIEGAQGAGEWVQDGHAALIPASGKTWSRESQPEFDTREHMLRDVLSRIAGGENFICTPGLATTHTRVVTALHRIAPIHEIAPAARSLREEGGDAFTFVPGLDDALLRAAERGCGLREAGASWAAAPSTGEIGP